MATERQRGNPPGPTSEAVAANLARVRRVRGVTLRGLSERLGAIGWPISWSALGKIENGARKVDVDDLTAIALALDVSPLGLLLARTSSAADDVVVTGGHDRAEVFWKWGAGYASAEAARRAPKLIPEEPDTDQASTEDAEADAAVLPDASLPRWLGLDFTEVSLPRWIDVGVIIRELPADEVPRWHAGELREWIERQGGESDG